MLMHFECPRCQFEYDIPIESPNVLFVCHRCNLEFLPENHQKLPWAGLLWKPVQAAVLPAPWLNRTATTERPMHADAQNEAVPDDMDEDNHEPDQLIIDEITDVAAPVRKNAHLWPWFLIMLVVVAVSGFWVQKDAWLDNRWFRSTLINFGFAMPMRDKDWLIHPASVESEWISRSDGSKALFIRGSIQNLMSSEMPLPAIEMVFFSKSEPQKQLGTISQEIGIYTSKDALLKNPDVKPGKDNLAVPAMGSRKFSLLVESVPDETGDFTLTPRITSP